MYVCVCVCVCIYYFIYIYIYIYICVCVSVCVFLKLSDVMTLYNIEVTCHCSRRCCCHSIVESQTYGLTQFGTDGGMQGAIRHSTSAGLQTVPAVGHL
jgi:hypothetical protein